MTINHEKVVQDINAVLHKLGQNNAMQQTCLKIVSQQLQNEGEVWCKLQALKLTTGWWQRQSSQGVWQAGDVLQEQLHNHLLAGEWAGSGTAVRIQAEGALWRWTEMTESSEGCPVLVSHQRLLGTNGEYMHYKIYSEYAENRGGMRALAFALTEGDAA